MITVNITKLNIYNFFFCIKRTKPSARDKVCPRSGQYFLLTFSIFGTAVLVAAAVINAKATQTALVGKSKLASRV